jgi:hypothetical protein
MMPGAGGDVNTTLPLILGIVATVLCCLGGVPSLIFAILAMNAKKAGDVEGARSKAKIATIIGAIAIVLSLCSTVIWTIVNLAGH